MGGFFFERGGVHKYLWCLFSIFWKLKITKQIYSTHVFFLLDVPSHLRRRLKLGWSANQDPKMPFSSFFWKRRRRRKTCAWHHKVYDFSSCVVYYIPKEKKNFVWNAAGDFFFFFLHTAAEAAKKSHSFHLRCKFTPQVLPHPTPKKCWIFSFPPPLKWMPSSFHPLCRGKRKEKTNFSLLPLSRKKKV